MQVTLTFQQEKDDILQGVPEEFEPDPEPQHDGDIEVGNFTSTPESRQEVIDVVDKHTEVTKPISAAQVKRLVTITGKLPPELKKIEEKAREVKYKGRSRNTFTQAELEDHLDYIEHLKGTVA